MRIRWLPVLLLMVACEPKKADPRYELHEETVKDTVTGLTWQRRSPDDNATLQVHQDYCANVILDGYSGFRVPTIKELRGITRKVRVYEALRQKPAIDRVAFPGTPTVNFWAVPEADNPKVGVKAWVVDFSDGTSNNLVTPFEGYRVRCVR